MIPVRPPGPGTLRQLATELELVALVEPGAARSSGDPYRGTPGPLARPTRPGPRSDGAVGLALAGAIRRLERLGAALERLAWDGDARQTPGALRRLHALLTEVIAQLELAAGLEGGGASSASLADDPALFSRRWRLRSATAAVLVRLAATVEIHGPDLDLLAAGARPRASGSPIDQLLEWARGRRRPLAAVAAEVLSGLARLAELSATLGAPAAERLPPDPAEVDPVGRALGRVTVLAVEHLFEAHRLARALGETALASELLDRALAAVDADRRAPPALLGLARLRRADLHRSEGRDASAEALYAGARHALGPLLRPGDPLLAVLDAALEGRERGPIVGAHRPVVERAIAELGAAP